MVAHLPAICKAATLAPDDLYLRAAQAGLDLSPIMACRKSVAFIKGPDAIGQGERVAALCRATTKGQKEAGSLERQEQTARSEIGKAGGELVEIYSKAGVQGHSEEWFHYLASVFTDAEARQIRKIVITVLSRLVRSPDYVFDNGARPSAEQLERIGRLAEAHGITIVCLCRPDASLSEERSWQTKHCGCAGRPKGSRSKYAGWSTQRTQRIRQLALDAVDAGHSYRQAAAIVNETMHREGWFIREISHETVRKWDLRRKAEAGQGGTDWGVSDEV